MKNQLLEALKNYQTSYQDEQKMILKTIEFLEENDIYLGKKNNKGHVTGSAWIVNKTRDKILLTHHFKLNMWVQLGGHTEEDESVYESAYREGLEESGLSKLLPIETEIFDVDVHLIPGKNNQEGHYHYDVRYYFEGDETALLNVSDESHDLAWVAIDDIETYTKEWSVLRMVEKTRR